MNRTDLLRIAHVSSKTTDQSRDSDDQCQQNLRHACRVFCTHPVVRWRAQWEHQTGIFAGGVPSSCHLGLYPAAQHTNPISTSSAGVRRWNNTLASHEPRVFRVSKNRVSYEENDRRIMSNVSIVDATGPKLDIC
ncbi:uncharacterized [Tachysurus ichikawai]